MNQARRSASASSQPRALYLRLTIDADMGEAFTALCAVSPRKRNREATYFLRRGLERGNETFTATPASAPAPAAPAAAAEDGTPGEKDHLAGMPGIDD